MFNPELLNVWLGLQVAGSQIGVPLLLATLWFSSLKRLKTLYNLLLTWFVSGLVGLLL